MTQAFDNAHVAAARTNTGHARSTPACNVLKGLTSMPQPRDTDPILPVVNMAARPGEKKRVLIVGAGAAGTSSQDTDR